MYQILLYIHSLFRWLVLLSLIYSIYRAWRGYISHSAFTGTDNSIRHWTATIAHIQLTLGVVLYFKSPFTRASLKHTLQSMDLSFFSIIHLSMMVVAILLITIGSALSKRKTTDPEKFRTLLIWFSIALLIILLAIPWPFSPFTHRPYFRL
ncbi:hypothetical protein GFS24_23020 [Chitinophaga sp. SYP-B3965]|uniref:hypothetical protein n=1 Tax=Chitinophaga sp. SYP-B3965 TaxID=2663120 RepID=UPI001299C826|nr:hypothetical protein [Chitinophaga sp. SYP-B3965]MRG48011.1 hypothetical protein [Chitinophaga sp. SYP-B3965]